VINLDDAISELERAHVLGLRAVALRQFPNGSGSPDPTDDRFWARSLELGMALAPHVVFGTMLGTSPRGPEVSRNRLAAAITQHATALRPEYCISQLIFAGVFDRFPELQLYFAEVNAGYLAGALYYMDRDFTTYNEWFKCDLNLLPSEYIRSRVYFGMVQEAPLVLRMRELVPLDRLMWGSDFPHSVGTYPESTKYLEQAFENVDEITRRTILLENPARFFGLDLDAAITETPAA
jgi:predicted TIM-barrel fold metal-dependent hydrolase